MTEADRTPAELAAELIAADRPSQPVEADPPPVVAVGDPFALMAYPWLRRHRRQLLPLILVAIVVVLVLSVLS